MNNKNIESAITNEIKNLRYSFSELDSKFSLTINNININFLKNSEYKGFSPNKWFRSVHKKGNIHEPGLIAALIFLNKILKKEKVIFYDIGALYGYHSLIFHSLFKDSRIIAIEGNPKSAEYIKFHSNSITKFKVLNRVMATTINFNKYFITGFTFEECNIFEASIKSLKIFLKNIIKTILNPFFTKKFELRRGHFYKLKSINIPSILDLNKENRREIIKIDTEGSQAIFLKPFITNLCKIRSIVLLELDRPIKMAKYKTTNENLIQEFIKNKYNVYWLDHRLGKKVYKISKINKKQDKNSLVILLPNGL